MEPTRAPVTDDTWKLNRELAGARAALDRSRKRIRYYEVLMADQLNLVQDIRRQMYLLNIKEEV